MSTIVWIDEDIDKIEALVKPIKDSPEGHRLIPIHGVARARDSANKIIKEILTADLIILDIIGPPGNAHNPEERYAGLSFLRELRQLGWNRPVVILSVVAAQLAEQLKTLHVAESLTKPVRPSTLKEAVDRALKQSIDGPPHEGTGDPSNPS